nr:MAG TPA: hypothetical protein [Caudoviricetes sp.]DAK02055.1 MAG TPA: hypothetical protein [Caudoviricetes sp.]
MACHFNKYPYSKKFRLTFNYISDRVEFVKF